LRFGENGNGKTKNKMRGGIQFRNKEEEKEEDGERAQFDAWIVTTFFINEKRDDDNENKALLADLREHVFKEFRHQDKRERFERRKKEFQNLAVGMGFTLFRIDPSLSIRGEARGRVVPRVMMERRRRRWSIFRYTCEISS
jgi:hypothetical protein